MDLGRCHLIKSLEADLSFHTHRPLELFETNEVPTIVPSAMSLDEIVESIKVINERFCLALTSHGFASIFTIDFVKIKSC